MSDQTLTPEPDGAIADEAAPADPNSELLDALRTWPGEWFVVHSYAGQERRVKANIEEYRKKVVAESADDPEIYQIEVPLETVWEIKKGERKRVERVKLPSYVLVRMEPTPECFAAIRNTPGVTGFVGRGADPVPLSIEEVFEMLKAPERAPVGSEPDQKKTQTTGKTVTSDFHPGDVVTVIDGPFESLQATISEVNPEAQRITAMVELFGRDTPVELRFDQISAV